MSEPAKSSAQIELTDHPTEAELATVVDGLVQFNAGDIGPSGRQMIAVLIRDQPDGRIQGGLVGYTAWGWLFVEKLYVAEALRGQGFAGRLLAEAEAEAVRRGCKAVWIDTFNPTARRVYERQGFVVFGELADFPVGRSRFFLQKRLDTEY